MASRGAARGPTPKVGDKVEITAGASRGVVGIVRFFDETKFATGKWLGVELAYEGGKNDGTVQGEKYFSCPARYGLFVKTPMVKVVPPSTPLTTAAMAAQLALQLDQEDAKSGMSTFSSNSEMVDTAPSPSPRPPAPAAPEAVLSPRGDKPPPVARTPSKSPSADPMSPRKPAAAPAATPARKPNPAASSLAPPTKAAAKTPAPAPAGKAAPAPAAKPTPAKPAAGIKPPVARQPSASSVMSPRGATPSADKPSAMEEVPTLSEKKEQLTDLQSKVSSVRSTEDSSLMAQAEKAAQSTKRADERAEARAAKQDARALEQTKKELEEALAENADLKSKLKNVQGTVAELKKSELKATAANSKLEEKIASLNDVIENLTLDKELAEETCEEVKGEVETLNKQITDLKIQVENAKKEALSAQDQLLKSLPNDQAEVARIVQQNSLLTDACRQLRDKAVAEQDKYNVAIEQAKRTIAKLSEDAAQLKDTKAELTKAKQEILDLREELDEQANNAEMIEELSDKNLMLGEQIDELKGKIKEMQKLIEVSEECEDNHQALEEELQAALDAKESEFTQLDKRYKLQQVKVDDLQKTIVQFRAELAAAQNYSATLEGKITTISEDREEVKNRNRDALARAMKLAARMGDLRQHIVQHGVADISVEQAQYALAFLKTYIPENMGIDETSLQLLSLVERIRSKASLVMRFMEEFYGPEVALQSGGHDKDDGLSLTAFAGQVGGLMLTLVSSIHILHRNLSSADPENYSHAAQRHKPLSQAEAILDDFLSLIAKDRLNEQTPLAALQLAIDVVRKFTATYFAPPQGTAPDPSGNPSPIDDSLPRCDNPESLLLSLQKYKLTELTIRANVRVIGDLVHQLQADINQNAEAKAAQEEARDAEKVFTGLEELQRTTLSLVTKLVAQAENLRKPEVAIWFVNSDPLINGLKRLEPLSAAAQNAVVELCRKIKIAVAGAGDVGPAAISAMIRVMNQDAADTAAGTAAAVTSLNNGFAALLPIVEDRVQGAQRALGGRQDDRPSVWARHSKSIKKELMEAASMRHKLDEAHASVLAKNEELFGEQRRSRELLAKVKVLEDRLRIIEPQAGNRAELAADLSRYKREAEDIKEAFETSQRDLEAFGRENAVMKAKIKNLEGELAKKSNLSGGGNDPAAETAVTGELDILRKTVRALRRQLAGIRTDALQKQMEALPALPQLKVNMLEPGHHAAADRIAREAQRERIYDEDMVAQQKRVTVLSKNVGEVTRRLRDLRSSPVIVDLATRSAVETDSTRQFFRQQAEKKRLAADSQRLKTKLLSFLASTSHAVTQGQVAESSGALVGRVVIGSKESARKVAVPVGRSDLARLQTLVL